ncbi:MAG: dihydrolipoyl dehydrogenase family protein [Verrucomicrobiales bacterium]
MTEAANYDLAVIGGGSAGYAAARTAAKLGLHTVVIDGAEELGGLCILRGCMPSKALIESGNRAITLKRAQEFGLRGAGVAADTAFIIDRKRRLVADFAAYRREQLATGGFDLVRGTARFVDSHRLAIARPDGVAHIAARASVIATGSTISVPALPGLEETGFWTSDTLLDAPALPPSFIILGGGAVALELAHYLEALNSRVTIIQRSSEVLTMMDADVAHVVAEAFRARGMTLFTQTRLLRVEKGSSGKRVVFEHNGAQHFVEAAEVLMALGRRPAIEHLGLDAAQIEVAEGRIATLPTQQTSQDNIFAAGDVCGPLEVVHLAIQQGEIAARNAAALLRGERAGHAMDYRSKLFGIFTHPEAAAIGLNEAEAEQEGREVLVGKYLFADHGKAMIMGETEGFVKLLGDARSGEILGASVVGPQATELIHEIAVAMHFRATARQLAAAPHYHPTLSEIWTYPAEEIAEQVAD